MKERSNQFNWIEIYVCESLVIELVLCDFMTQQCHGQVFVDFDVFIKQRDFSVLTYSCSNNILTKYVQPIVNYNMLLYLSLSQS